MRDLPSHILRMAERWYMFESESRAPDAPPPRDKITLSDMLAIAVPRVEAVLCGEVRWSEASSGDRAIWTGRARFPTHTHPGSRWMNLWDTVEIGPGAPLDRRYIRADTTVGTTRLFGTENIGNWLRCNLEVPGQLAGDQTMEIAQMYAACDRGQERGESIGAVLVLGQELVAHAMFPDLQVGVPIGIALPPRQNFCVRIGWNHVERPITIRVHLEGLLSHDF